MNLGAARFFLATKKYALMRNYTLNSIMQQLRCSSYDCTTSQITRNEMHRKRNTSPVLNTSNDTQITLPAQLLLDYVLYCLRRQNS